MWYHALMLAGLLTEIKNFRQRNLSNLELWKTLSGTWDEDDNICIGHMCMGTFWDRKRGGNNIIIFYSFKIIEPAS